jgi:hypothetical protein
VGVPGTGERGVTPNVAGYRDGWTESIVEPLSKNASYLKGFQEARRDRSVCDVMYREPKSAEVGATKPRESQQIPGHKPKP